MLISASNDGRSILASCICVMLCFRVSESCVNCLQYHPGEIPAACRDHTLGPEGVPFPTSKYYFGAGALFDQDCFSGNPAVVTAGSCPTTKTDHENNKAFDRAGAFQARAFSIARSLGITTATGIELPVRTFPTVCNPRSFLTWHDSG